MQLHWQSNLPTGSSSEVRSNEFHYRATADCPVKGKPRVGCRPVQAKVVLQVSVLAFEILFPLSDPMLITDGNQTI